MNMKRCKPHQTRGIIQSSLQRKVCCAATIPNLCELGLFALSKEVFAVASLYQITVSQSDKKKVASINQEVNSLPKWREFPVHRHNSVNRHCAVSPAASGVKCVSGPPLMLIGRLNEAPSENWSLKASHWLTLPAYRPTSTPPHSGHAHCYINERLEVSCQRRVRSFFRFLLLIRVRLGGLSDIFKSRANLNAKKNTHPSIFIVQLSWI